MPTVSEIIDIAKVSQFLAANAIRNGGLFGNGIDRLLPRKLYGIRKNVEWLYNLDPTDETLTQTANYLYALCAPFSAEAAIIISASTGGIVVNPSTGQPTNYIPILLQFEMGTTASPVVVNGVNVTLPTAGSDSFILPLENVVEDSLFLMKDGVVLPSISVSNSIYTTISYTPTQATITLGPAPFATFENGQVYILKGFQTS